MSGCAGVKGKKESGIGGAAIAGDPVSPGMSLSGCNMCSAGSKPGGSSGGAPAV